MERVSDEYLKHLHDLYDRWITVNPYKAEDEPTAQLMADILNHQIRSTRDALTELRERRAKAPCPEHAKMVAEWDTYEMGRDDSSAAPFWCQLYAGSVLQGQGIGMTEGDAIRQALENVERKK